MTPKELPVTIDGATLLQYAVIGLLWTQGLARDDPNRELGQAGEGAALAICRIRGHGQRNLLVLLQSQLESYCRLLSRNCRESERILHL